MLALKVIACRRDERGNERESDRTYHEGRQTLQEDVLRVHLRGVQYKHDELCDELKRRRLDEDADDTGQPAAPGNARQALGRDAVVDFEDAVHDQA